MKKSNNCAYVNKGLRLNFLNQKNKTTVKVSPCCHLVKEFSDSGVPKFVPLDSSDSITDHPRLKHYKDYFTNNEDLHPSCVACKNVENSGVDSARQKLNELEQQNSQYDYLKLDVVISNKCNLACPFCSQGSSSLIETLSKKYSLDELPLHWKSQAGKQAEPEIIGETCAELLKKYKIHTFKILGGEPFLKENWEPIGRVLDQEYCKDVQLEITSNGTVMNSKIIERISKTRKTKLRISMDSVGDNYNFIRWPHSWKKMESNLLYLRDNKPKNCDVTLTVLANIFNFEFLPEIEEFFKFINVSAGIACIKNDFNFALKPLHSPLHWNNLPDSILDYVYNNLESSEAKKEIQYGRYLNQKIDIDEIKKDTEFYLIQRNMKATVLGPKTREWLCLIN